jgi:two-component system sporulation sensor kinase C
MNLLTLSIVASAGIKAIVFFLYLFFYFQYRERFLGYWAVAWALILLKSAMDPFLFTSGHFVLTFVFLQATAVGGILFIAWGTYNFVGQRLPSMWIYFITALACVSTVSVILELPALWFIIPTSVLFGSIHIQTGLILLRGLDTQGLGHKIAGWAFIINGLHQFDFPLFRPSDMAHWGYLLDAFLRLIISIGFLLAYFEKTHYDLREKEGQFRLLAENARDIIFRFRLKPGRRLHYISPAAAVITGYTPEEFYADNELLINIVHPEDRPLIWNAGQLALKETPLLFRMLTREQKIVWVELHFTLLRDRDGETTAVEGIVRDVTARKELEQELFRLDRLNIVGQMAANIGHEIRNPLTTVRGYLQVLARKPELMRYGDNFRLLLDELDRANALITEYLSLSKNRLTDQQPRNLNAIVESLFPLIVADAVSSNQIVTLELGAVPELPLDEKEIRQLLLNLVRNGLEAMEPGKTMTITTTATQEAVILSVQDQGRQIPADVLEKLGMPFFTTKEKGTGLGLAICYSIANRHRAKIHVDTGPQGTTFSVAFSLGNSLTS